MVKSFPDCILPASWAAFVLFSIKGGADITECIVFGQIAGRNAASPKSDEASPVPTAAKSNLRFSFVACTDLAAAEGPDVALANSEYLGVSHSGIGGDVYVKVTMEGDNIIAVEVVEHNETPGIGTNGIDIMPGRIVAAGSTEVDSVAGATTTSKAIKEAVDDALRQVK